ncbi:MAG: hypothetical protein IPK19_31165 [Chloroflexi bacterium]|nr:hypothetical protein [Chloroflexota bacterium]
MSRLTNYDFGDSDVYDLPFDGMNLAFEDRQQRRKRKPKANHRPKKSAADVVASLSDEGKSETELTMTYQPSRFEAGWLADSLRPFYDRGLIIDVLARVRGGKEASVYVCQASPAIGVPLLAAKVYRPRMFRQMRNDSMYREGREILTESGKVVKKTDHRVMRAIGKKTGFGVEVAHTSWLMYEQNTLQTLAGAALDVPHPYGSAPNAILMTYYGVLGHPAPTLSLVELDPEEAQALFYRAVHNIEGMLALGFIHGDLSAYNILYWEGDITVIDFPQVVRPQANPYAEEIFRRDVSRVCDYFADQGVTTDADALVSRLWTTYVPQED